MVVNDGGPSWRLAEEKMSTLKLVFDGSFTTRPDGRPWESVPNRSVKNGWRRLSVTTMSVRQTPGHTSSDGKKHTNKK